MSMSKVLTRAVVSMLVLAMMMAGCSSEKPLLEDLDKEKEVTLRILTNMDRMSFRNYYGGLFGIQYSNINIELIPFDERYSSNLDSIVALEANISRVRPDVVFLSPDAYERLAAERKLYNLEPIIRQEQFDVDTFLPGLIDWIRKKSGGALYGIAPSFMGRVLFYNADLFRQYGVELPHDGMTWDDVLKLAARFRHEGSSNDEVSGLCVWNIEAALFDISTNWGLELVDSKGEHMLIQSESWKRVFSQVVEAIQNRDIRLQFSIADNREIKEERSDLFLAGRAAMKLDWNMSVFSLQRGNIQGGNNHAFDWGVVTAPIDPLRPEETPYIQIPNIMAIPIEAEHKREAWEFIKFSNGSEKVERGNLRNFSFEMLTRGLSKKTKDYNKFETFYKLRMSQDRDSRPYPVNVPDSFTESFDKLLDQALTRMIHKDLTVEQGITELDTKGNELLKQARASQNGGGQH